MRHLTTINTVANIRLRTASALLLVALMLAAGCSATDEPAAVGETIFPVSSTSEPAVDDAVGNAATTVVTADGEPPVATTAVDREASAAEIIAGGVVLEAHDMFVEPSGVQMRVERIIERPDATYVRLAIINGSDDDKEVRHHNVATLTLPDGTSYEPVRAFPTRGVSLDKGDSSIVVLVYPPTSGPFDLTVGADGLLDSPFSPEVEFQFEDLDPARVVSGLQADAALAAVGTHPNGTQIELDGIRFTPDRIGLNIEFRNGNPRTAWLFGAHETYIEDDLGNRYRALVKPNGNSYFEVDAGATVSGVLTFAGRMDPRATSYTIFVNDGGLLTNDLARSPAFVLGPFDRSPTEVVGVPLDIDLDVTIDQFDGWSATLSGFRFDDESIRADLSIINGSDVEGDFNTGLIYVVDSEGITYQAQRTEAPELVLAPGEGFEGEIVFGGRLQPSATSIELSIRNFALSRSFFFEPVEVERSSSAAVLSSFVVPAFSAFEADSLDTSSVSEIAGAIAEFDGVEVEGGVLLTLPETILFDFGQSTLRPEATRSIERVAAILEYYSGDEVVVVGHTDSIGDDASNLTLSEDRATAVLDGLVAQGVTADLLSIIGRGESEPVAANERADGSDDPEGRQLNRRVEIFIKTDRGLPEG